MAATATSGHYIMAQTTIVMTVVVIGLLLLLKMMLLLLLYVVVSTAFILTCGIKFHCLLYVRGGPVILDVWLIGCSLVSGLSVKRIMEMVLVLVLVSVLDVCCAADDGDDDDDAYDGIGASRAGSCSGSRSRSCSSSSNNRAECLLVFLQRRRTRHSSFIAAFGHNEIVSRTRTKKNNNKCFKNILFCHK